MSSSDASWLNFWEWFATIGFVFVIVGCVIEGVEHFVKFKRNESKQRHRIEKLGWLILVGGLAMEFLGDKRAKRISEKENRRLTVEAAQSNERSLALEATNRVLSLRIEELKKANLDLEAIIQPRSLNVEQQNQISSILRRFAGRTVIVVSFSNDMEGAAIGAQINSALLKSGINVRDALGRAGLISGIDPGIHVFGPTNEQQFIEAVGQAFSSIGKLKTLPGSNPLKSGMSVGDFVRSDSEVSILVGPRPLPNAPY